MGTKDKQAARKQAARKQEQYHREARARAVRANLRGMAADLNELQEAETLLLTPDVIAKLHEEEEIPMDYLEGMRDMRWRWNPHKKSFVSSWEAGP
jgi:hypothetical protein